MWLCMVFWRKFSWAPGTICANLTTGAHHGGLYNTCGDHREQGLLLSCPATFCKQKWHQLQWMWAHRSCEGDLRANGSVEWLLDVWLSRWWHMCRRHLCGRAMCACGLCGSCLLSYMYNVLVCVPVRQYFDYTLTYWHMATYRGVSALFLSDLKYMYSHFLNLI